MSTLHITTIQSDIQWESPEKNILHYDELLKGVSNTDIIVLPEMFLSGFSTEPVDKVIAFAPRGLEWMQHKAASVSSAICGSLIVEENNMLFNRFYFVMPCGTIHFYDKKHLFSMAGENKKFTPGTKNADIQYKDFSIRLNICYDLRFPVWNRNVYNSEDNTYDYDILIFTANWPERRIIHWEKLLQARAIENQAYVVGVNRIGTDANNIQYNGSTMIVDAVGEIIYKACDNEEDVYTVTLQKEVLNNIRQKLPFAADWDKFQIQ